MKPVFLFPVLIAVLVLIGVVTALIAEDSWNWAALLCLAPSVLVALRTLSLLSSKVRNGS